MKRIAAALLLALVLPAGALADRTSPPPFNSPTGGFIPGMAGPDSSVADFWRTVKEGAEGQAGSPEKNATTLIRRQYLECFVDKEACTEKAVGFTVPAHRIMPSVDHAQGVGLTSDTKIFLAAVAAVLLAWCGFVFVSSGRARRGDGANPAE